MQIEVSKKSWHYRWYKFITEVFRESSYHWKDPTSVCPYFWGFILNNFWALFMSIIFSVGAVSVVALLTSPIWGAIRYWYLGLDYKGLIVAAITYTIIVAFGTFAFIATNQDEISESFKKVTHKGKVGVIFGFFYAVKNKVCPKIDYRE